MTVIPARESRSRESCRLPLLPPGRAAIRCFIFLFSLFCAHGASRSFAADHPQHTPAAFDGWVRQSTYIPATDGTRLAVDYYRPTLAGIVHTDPLPVIWRFTPYGRYKLGADGRIENPNALPVHGKGLNGPRAMRHLLENGYVLAVADWRGYSASFGVSETWLGPQQAADARDITDWLAAQPWSTDRIGMMGLSALASVQYLAATDASPHLKAIFAAMGQFDHYDTFYLNGIYRPDLPAAWDRHVRPPLDYSVRLAEPGGVAAVDTDFDRGMLVSAALQHSANRQLSEQVAALPFRDSADPETGRKLHVENSLWPKLAAIRESKMGIYHWTGWFDAYSKGQLLAFSNLDNPQKIHIGPYFHADRFGVDLYQEVLRWFDFWLKGIDNGIMDEPPVRYFMLGEGPDTGWRFAESWPPGPPDRLRLHLHPGPSGSVASVNDGKLAQSPASAAGSDLYTVDRSISLGSYLERNNGTFRAHCTDKSTVNAVCYMNSGYPDLATRYDAKALTYTTAPLEEDLYLIGHPLVNLWVGASTPDAAVFVVLEEVEADGSSHFLADNALRLSHRTVNPAPFDNLGLPWLGNYVADASPLGSGPVAIRLDLKPIANKFDAGNRIRLTIAGSDAKSGEPVGTAAGQTLELFRGGQYPSWLEIPVLPPGAGSQQSGAHQPTEPQGVQAWLALPGSWR